MKKLFALLLALIMVFALAACDLGNTANPNKDSPGTSQNGGENNNGGESTDNGGENEDNGFTIADCNAVLDEMGITGFRFPEDLTTVQCKVSNLVGSYIDVRYCPVEQDRYEEILQSLFSDTGLTTTNQFGEAISTLDEAKGVTSVADRPNHGFNLTGNGRTFYVSVYYYPAEYNDMLETFEAKTLTITVSQIFE